MRISSRLMRLPPAARPIFERMAYVLYMGLLICSMGMTWIGWMIGAITGRYTIMICALAGLLVSRWLHVQGHAHWHFREIREILDSGHAANGWPRSEAEEKLCGEIDGLLNRMDKEPDVWTRGELRREIATKLAAAPTLRNEFAEKIARHPGL